MLNKYKKKVSKLLENIEKLKTVLSENNSIETIKSINKLIDKIKQEKFLVVSFGGFSSGKTTFLNALIGDRILPAKTLPTTATINYLLYSKKPSAVIQFKDEKLLKEDKKSGIDEFKKLDVKFKEKGKRVTINIEEIEEFVTDSKISPYVKEVFLYYPSKILDNGIIFVDTPGTDSIIKAHKRISYNFIEKADVILFFIWAPRPFTKSDFEFLSDIKSLRKFIQEDKFFFILNAIDGIDEQPIEEVINYVRNILIKKSGIENPNIIPISSRLALYYKLFKNNIIDKNDKYFNKLLRFNTEDNDVNSLWNVSNFEKIETDISNYLVKAKGDILIKKAKDILFTVIDNSLNRILIEKKTFKKSIEEVEKEINENLIPLLNHQRQEKLKLINYATTNIDKIKNNINYSDIEQTIKELVNKKLNKEIDTYKYSRQLNYISMDIKKYIEDNLNNILKRIVADMNDITNNIQKAINKNFDIPLEMEINIGVEPDINISVPDIQEVHSGENDYGDMLFLGLLGGILAFLIPGGMGFIGGALLGAGAGYILDESSKTSDSKSSISSSIETIKEKIFGKINSKINNIKVEIEEKLNYSSKTISESISETFDYILDKIEYELNMIKEKRKEFNDKFIEREKVLNKWEKELTQVKTNLNNFI